jgi:hypothetical protein
VAYIQAMQSACERLAKFWDIQTECWLAGDDRMPSPLPQWFNSYQGNGAGAVAIDGLPEPYHGDLLGRNKTPRMVILGLNPGGYHADFQSRTGIFAEEIRESGSYSMWSATGPYVRPPWTGKVGKNRYWRSRIAFTSRWLQDPGATVQDLLIFEAYPWHSRRLTAPIRPPADVMDRFVWQPIAELAVCNIFAFGGPWADFVQSIRLPLVDALGAGGRPYGSAVPSRAIRVYRLPFGHRLIVEWHSGSAGPPNDAETTLMREALT